MDALPAESAVAGVQKQKQAWKNWIFLLRTSQSSPRLRILHGMYLLPNTEAPLPSYRNNAQEHGVGVRLSCVGTAGSGRRCWIMQMQGKLPGEYVVVAELSTESYPAEDLYFKLVLDEDKQAQAAALTCSQMDRIGYEKLRWGPSLAGQLEDTLTRLSELEKCSNALKDDLAESKQECKSMAAKFTEVLVRLEVLENTKNDRGKRQRPEEEEEELCDCDKTPLRRACKSDKLEKGAHVLVKPTKGNTPRKMWVMRTDSGRAFIQLCANKTLESGLRGLYKLDEIYLCHCNNKRTRLLAEQ